MPSAAFSNEAVLRRAFELAAATPHWAHEHRLTPAELAEIADEVGLPLEALALALAEKAARVDEDRNIIDRLVGPAEIVGNRVASSGTVELDDQLVEWLETGHGLRARRSGEGLFVADRRTDLVGKLGRGLRSVQGLGGLGKAKGVRGAVVDVGDGAVCLVVDVSDQRRNALLGGSAVGAGGAVAVTAVAAIFSPLVLIGLPVAVGAGLLTSRGVYHSTVSPVEKTLEQTLDGIAGGQRPPSVLDGVGRGLNRQLRRGRDPRNRPRSGSDGISSPPTPPQIPPPPPSPDR